MGKSQTKNNKGEKAKVTPISPNTPNASNKASTTSKNKSKPKKAQQKAVTQSTNKPIAPATEPAVVAVPNQTPPQPHQYWGYLIAAAGGAVVAIFLLLLLHPFGAKPGDVVNNNNLQVSPEGSPVNNGSPIPTLNASLKGK